MPRTLSRVLYLSFRERRRVFTCHPFVSGFKRRLSSARFDVEHLFVIVIFRTKNIVVKIRGEQIVDKQFKIKDAISFSINVEHIS